MRISGPAPTHMISVLRYRDPARAVAWLCAAFGFNVHHVVKASNDDMMCAQLTLGSSMFIIGRVGDASFDALMKQPDEVGGAETQLTYIVVADIDEHCQRAKRSGAAIAVELGDYEEGGRGYSCRDLEGHVWSFGSFDPWKLGPPAVPAVRRSWSTRPLAALAFTVALAGAAAAAWTLVVSPDGRATDFPASERSSHWPTSAHENEAAQPKRSTELSDAQEREAEHAGRLQAALSAEEAAIRAVAALERDLQALQAVKASTEERASQLTMDLEAARAAIANSDRSLRDSKKAFAEERVRNRAAEEMHAQQRQHLQDQLAVAKIAHEAATEQLELLRNRPPVTPLLQTTRSHGESAGGATAARHLAPVPLPERDSKSADQQRRANLRRQCAQIKLDPEAYEKALVDLCQTL
jgi:uncharacterized glyoxalase superfamily protein PhnB